MLTALDVTLRDQGKCYQLPIVIQVHRHKLSNTMKTTVEAA
jgi:hypothetical protein